mgnify:CR=1 FL=1
MVAVTASTSRRPLDPRALRELRTHVQGDEGTVAIEHAQDMHVHVGHPEGFDDALAAALKMLPGVVERLHELLDAEVLVGHEADEDLTAPGEAESVDGSGVLQPLEAGAEGWGDRGGHGR